MTTLKHAVAVFAANSTEAVSAKEVFDAIGKEHGTTITSVSSALYDCLREGALKAAKVRIAGVKVTVFYAHTWQLTRVLELPDAEEKWEDVKVGEPRRRKRDGGKPGFYFHFTDDAGTEFKLSVAKAQQVYAELQAVFSSSIFKN